MVNSNNPRIGPTLDHKVYLESSVRNRCLCWSAGKSAAKLRSLCLVGNSAGSLRWGLTTFGLRYLYHQYSNARVTHDSPIPTKMTMNTPPATSSECRVCCDTVWLVESNNLFLIKVCEKVVQGDLKVLRLSYLSQIKRRKGY